MKSESGRTGPPTGEVTSAHGSAFWKRHARRYEAATLWLNSRFPEIAALVAEDLSGCERVLEVGAGTGLVTTRLAGTVGEIVATDYSLEMLGALREKVSEARLTNVNIQQANVLALPFSDQTFAGAVAANLLHLLPTPIAALNELRRVVRKGGVICIPTFAHGETLLAQVVSRVLGIAGFPVVSRFRGTDLRTIASTAGGEIIRDLLIPGILPLHYVAARFM